MTNGLNRRGFLKGAGAAALLASPLMQWASAQSDKTKKILFFTRSAGFEHDTIQRKNPEKLGFAEQWMVDFGKKNNFDVNCTKDGGVFTEEGLAPYDLIMFYTTGILDGKADSKDPQNHKPMPPGGKELFLKLIADGKKGFLGVHSSSDTFHGKGDVVDPYIKMIGGEFLGHNAQEGCRIVAVDEDWGPIKGLKTFTKTEEWYRQKNVAPDMHVLLWQDTSSMKQAVYNTFDPYPETWARMHGKGRVFYTSMGHRKDVWNSPEFAQVLLGGLQWASGNADGEVKNNVKEITPKALFREPDTNAG
jgi:type 1 glutamine amidotransferase